jgi:hypothetical protein
METDELGEDRFGEGSCSHVYLGLGQKRCWAYWAGIVGLVGCWCAQLVKLTAAREPARSITSFSQAR